MGDIVFYEAKECRRVYRLFVAIDLPDEVKEHIANICFGVPGAKWVPKDQSHLTLRFIGEVDDNRYAQVSYALSEVIASGFDLTISGVGHFPPRNRPTVLWVGIEKNEEFIALKKEIDNALKTTEIAQEDRKFAAHITVARLGLHTPVHKVAEFLSVNGLFKITAVPVRQFHLYSSVLTPSGAVHRKETTYTLL
jgi:RNA 2',3'-cyclic 3'-phosphodiesterase